MVMQKGPNVTLPYIACLDSVFLEIYPIVS
jgi:hypothetical protein